MFLIPAFALSLALLLWAVFTPWPPTIIFLALVAGVNALLFAADMARLPPPRGLVLSPTEAETFRRHHIYLRFPGASANFCQLLQGLRWSGVIWVPVLLFKGLWIPALLLVVNFLVTGSLSVRLNPIGPYQLAASEGSQDLGREAERLRSILQRIHLHPSDLERGARD